MTFQRSKKGYGGHHSWRAWRDANATQLADAGVPIVALESEWSWHFFLQEAEPTLMGGPPFDVDALSDEQVFALRSLLRAIPETNGVLVEALERSVTRRKAGFSE